MWVRREASDPPLRVGRVTALTTAPGLELDPALSPDGRMLAYVSGPPGRMRIYLRQIEGSRDVPLTTDDGPSNQRWSQWSPDGQRILFQAGFRERHGRSTEAAPRGTIYTVPALGGTARALVEATPTADSFAPAWSPDGTEIAFVRSDALNTAVVWTPDSRSLLFVSDREGRRDVFRIAVGSGGATGQPQRVTTVSTRTRSACPPTAGGSRIRLTGRWRICGRSPCARAAPCRHTAARSSPSIGRDRRRRVVA